MDKAFGPERAVLLGQRLFELAGVPSIEALRALPAIDLRDDDSDGRLMLAIDETLSIIFEISVPPDRSGLAVAGQEVTIIDIRSTER